MTKLSIIYYSSTGHGQQMAERIQQAAQDAGAEVRLRQVAETAPQEAIESNPQWAAHHEATRDQAKATPEDIVWADAVIFGSPTRYGSQTSQFQSFIDTLGPYWMKGQLADKVYAAYTSSQTQHGGQESTLLSMYTLVHHFGGYIVSPGYTDQLKFTDGNPYGVSHVTGAENNNELEQGVLEALDHMARRVVDVAGRLTA